VENIVRYWWKNEGNASEKNEKIQGECGPYSFVETLSLPTDAHNVKKHRVIKTF